ncbi:hypothetical protein ACFLW3_01275 [Chloroflexota bacterium]
MKHQALLIVTIVLIASLVCMGAVSCSQDSNEEQNGSYESVTQPLTEDEYNIEIAAIALELITAVNGLNQTLSKPEIDDSNWITTINLAIEDINTLCDEACQIEQPDSMTDIHIVNLESIANLDSAAGLLADGIDKKDIDIVNQATTEMWLAAEILADVIEVSE